MLQIRIGVTIIVVAWVLSILIGTAVMGHEALTPVTSTTFAGQFPDASAIPLAADKPTLIVFAHPQCPCTRATFHELASVMQQTQNRASLVIVFTLPPGVPADWEKGDLYQLAQAMPAHIILDRGGIEAQRLHVVGSGTTLLYSAGRKLLFSGGITSARGHEGDSVGSEALTSLLLHGTATVASAPVFGCSLL